jgi:hypothetical protein
MAYQTIKACTLTSKLPKPLKNAYFDEKSMPRVIFQLKKFKIIIKNIQKTSKKI